MSGPLDGVRVIDLTAVVSGPFCTMLLADQGADVIKVEAPGTGDIVRLAGTNRGGLTAIFGVLNRGKRSVVLNLREARAREILLDLARDADVFAQNFRPGAAERMGVGYEVVRKVNPDIVYVSISGFGPTGPYANKRVYDPVIQALSGMAAVQAHPETRTPDLVRNIVCDKVTALTAAQAITAALFARERGAGGQHLELAMLDAAISFLWPDAMMNETFVGEGAALSPALSDFYQITQTADGFMTWFTVSDQEFHGLCRALDRPEWIEDPRFGSLAARLENILELYVQLEEEFAKRPTRELLERLEAEDVPCAPIQAPGALATDPQVEENRMLVELEHPHGGRMRQPRPAVRFAATGATAGGPAPMLGEHTDEILSGLGIAKAELERLRAAGVVS